MDKNSIKKYAVWAREELIKRVSAKAIQYGIEKDNIIDSNADTVNGNLLTSNEKKQRADLITQIKTKGYEQVMEEVSYTWFNRFIALRFMEVNNYLPTHIRVFTDEENNFAPQILAEAIHLELDGLDKSKVLDLKEKNANDELYKYLLITQCNALNSILPQMFQRILDYTELLFPDNILREGSVIQQMITLIPEEDWQDAVQIIGWLYQYYNSVPKDTVFANLKKNIKIKKEDIPAATQLFTPDWIVRYMVENSLGRLWYEGHPNDELKSNWKYYLDEAEQEIEVQAQLDKIREEYKNLKPKEIKCIDPCMGSGHILVYMFDVLMQIYESYGYSTRDAAASIVQNNLYGLDIDDRAAQLAYFAVMMKARAYDRRFFSRDIQPHIYAIPDYMDWKEYGSLTIIDKIPQKAKKDNSQIAIDDINDNLLNTVVDVAEVLTQKYDVVITNPPYMGASGMGAKLSDFVKKHYPDSKSDLFSVFIERCSEMTKPNRYYAMITQPSFLFLSSFEKLRIKILNTNTISSLLHMGRGIFGIDFGSTSFVIKKKVISNYLGCYFRLHERTFQYIDPDDIAKLYIMSKGDTSIKYDFSMYDTKTENINNDEFSGKELQLYYESKKENFSKIPGSPIAYWVSENFIRVFESGASLEKYTVPKQGIKNGDKERFLRYWYEIENNRFTETKNYTIRRWFPCNKGGSFRKWYGNNEYVVNWENDGFEIRNLKDENGKLRSRPQNLSYMLKEGLTYTNISSGSFAVRYCKEGFIYDANGSGIYGKKKYLYYSLAFLTSAVASYLTSITSATISFEVGQVASLPLVINEINKPRIETLVEQNISISKTDWDSFETSWDFEKHPLLKWLSSARLYRDDEIEEHLIEDSFNSWKIDTEYNFAKLKQNEEELNRIFIEIYGLQDELTPEVEDKDVTVRKADLKRDIKSLISYAVGCMYGRYSLDIDGLVYAGGEFDNSNYSTYPADADNIIPICDDEYFEDDIVGRFVEFVKTVYGTETLEENLRFIAVALGGKGQPKEIIRNYFLNEFFADHCKIYQKRPIYWLFDSGKKNGFKALIYMHRYQSDTIARMRTDYVHQQQGRYRTAIADLEHRLNDATTADRVKLTKQLTTIKDQDTELRQYEEKIHHLADQMISIDLDDGVKNNYEIFKDVLAKIK